MSAPCCARWFCQCPSLPGPPSCLPDGWAKMMLGSLRPTGPWLEAGPVGLPAPPPEAGRTVNLMAEGEGAGPEELLSTGPWMGQEGEARCTWCCWPAEGWGWWEGSSPRADSAPGWNWPGCEGAKLKSGRGTCGWAGCLEAPLQLVLL